MNSTQQEVVKEVMPSLYNIVTYVLHIQHLVIIDFLFTICINYTYYFLCMVDLIYYKE